MSGSEKNIATMIELKGRETHAFLTGKINGRTKLIVWAVFTLFVLSVPKYDLAGVMAFAGAPLFLVLFLDLPIKIIARRMFILSFFVVFIAIANPLCDRRPFFSIGDMTVTCGMVSGLVIFAKSLVLVMASVIFSMCLPFNRICNALLAFRVPDVFITQLMLLYRYSFLLFDEAATIQKAREMRSFGGKGREFMTTAGMLGSLLVRTVARAERIYRGMFARGFAGSVHHGADEEFGWGDILFLLGSLAFFMALRAVFL